MLHPRDAYLPLYKRNYRNYGQRRVKRSSSTFGTRRFAAKRVLLPRHSASRILVRISFMFHPRLIYAEATWSRHADHRKRCSPLRGDIVKRTLKLQRGISFANDRSSTLFGSSTLLSPPPGRIIRPLKVGKWKNDSRRGNFAADRPGCATTRSRLSFRGAL